MRALQLPTVILWVPAILAGHARLPIPIPQFPPYGLTESNEIWWQIVRDFHKCICLEVEELVFQLSLA